MSFWLIPAVIITLVASLMLELVYLYLYLQKKERALLYWTIAWAVYVIRYIIILIALLAFPQIDWLARWAELFTVLFLLAGAWNFFYRSHPPGWIMIGGILMTVLYTVLYVYEAPFLYQHLPPFLMQGAVFICLGILFLRFRLSAAYVIVGFSFLLWGLHKLDFPFLRTVAWFAPIGFTASAFFGLTVALFTILIYYVRSQYEQSILYNVSRDMISIIEPDGTLVQLNPAWQINLGWTINELLRFPLFSMLHPDDQSLTRQYFHRLNKDGTFVRFENRFRHRSDGYRWLEWNATRHADGSIYCIARDITENKLNQHRLTRSHRALRVLSESSMALSTAANEAALLKKVCNICVEHGGYSMAWVGYAYHDRRKSVFPIASAGIEEGYLDGIQISWGDNEYGQGPTGMAIRTNRPSVARNLSENVLFGPWRERAAQRGYRCSIALPIAENDLVFGALNLYSTEEQSFDADEIQLLGELCSHLTLGITLMRIRQAHERQTNTLRENELILRSMFEQAPAGMLLLGNDNQITRANACFCEIIDIPPDGVLFRKLPGLLNQDEGFRFKLDADLSNVRNGVMAACHLEFDMLVNGRTRWLQLAASAVRDANGKIHQLIVIVENITERKQAHDELRKLSLSIEQSPTSIFITDADGVIQYVNQTFTEVTRYTPMESIGSTPHILQSGQTPAEVYRDLLTTIRNGDVWRGEILNRTRDGRLIWMQETITPILNDQGIIAHFTAMCEDISLRKEYEQRLLHESNFDRLTGLPNRLLASDRFERSAARAELGKTSLALLLVDLDHFKHINDSMGHDTGDRVLIEAAARLQSCVTPVDTVARYGGDEFIIILDHLDDSRSAEQVARSIIEVFARSIHLDTNEVFISPSIGVTFYPDDGRNYITLLKNADAAMHLAKEQGRNTFRFFTRELNDRSIRRMLLASHLRNAIDNGELVLHYQPVVNLTDERIVAAEVLMRWQNLELGDIPPGVFISLAEETGLIHRLGNWCLEEAGRQSVAWRRQGFELALAINVSSRQLNMAGFSDVVLDVCQRHEIRPDTLELEITENLLMQDDPVTEQQLKDLARYGIRIALDDFGTGYSSLHYLKRFAFQTLKIDRSFISDVHTNRESAHLVKAILALAHSLKLRVIAEGVETREQSGFLYA
ncbi:MAG: EAL domain-containing protein, partial [Leptospiraceae bacterium]|nr:EAL domain-containing protein [Leptospiraceae bacterium]